MAKRGKVLRDPHLGPGLLIVEGKQYPFLMEGLWRSDVPAKPGLVVNVDFDAQGNLNGITPAPQSQPVEEQTELARAGSGVRSPVFGGWALGSGALARVAAAGLLVVSWFLLTAVSIHLPFFGTSDLTFWQVLGYLNTGYSLQLSEVTSNPDSGILGFLAILVLAGPFLRDFWKDPPALLGGVLPLGFMLLVAYRIAASIQAALAAQMTGPYESLHSNLRYGIFDVLSVGLGTYLSASLAVYFAVLSIKQLVGSRRLRERRIGSSQKMAA